VGHAARADGGARVGAAGGVCAGDCRTAGFPGTVGGVHHIVADREERVPGQCACCQAGAVSAFLPSPLLLFLCVCNSFSFFFFFWGALQEMDEQRGKLVLPFFDKFIERQMALFPTWLADFMQSHVN
jgi:hypothetical protein